MSITFSIWTRDGMGGWNKGAALYAGRADAAATAVSCVGRVLFQGGAYLHCTDVRVFPSEMGRSDVLARIASTS